jgi:hypothetical protein
MKRHLDWAEADEETRAVLFQGWGEWNQNVWGQVELDESVSSDEAAKLARNGACQTAYCQAGSAAYQAGYRLLYGWDNTAHSCIQERPTGQKDEKGHDIWEIVPGAPRRDISDVGQEFFGLNEEQAGVYFEGENSLDALKAYCNAFALEWGQPLPYPDHSVASRHEDDEDGVSYSW